MSKSDHPGVRFPPPLTFAGFLAGGLWLDGSLGRPVPDFGALQAIGAMLGLTALVLIGAALGLFRRAGTRPEPWQPASTLVTTGMYRLSRNPMYLGMALLHLAIALYLSSLSAVVTAFLAALLIDQTVIRREEAYLLRRFGADYQSYCSKVRRWL